MVRASDNSELDRPGGLKNFKQLIEGKINPENNQQRMEQIRQTYIGCFYPVGWIGETALVMNRKVDSMPVKKTIPSLRRDYLKCN